MSIFMHQYFKVAVFSLTCFSLILFGSVPVFSDEGKESFGAPQFFSSLRDIPLMQGMEELESRAISFDKPGGRISESYAVIHDLRRVDVLYFYQQTLPQLGWGQVSATSFFRQNEMLEFSFEEHDGRKTIKVMIGPTL